MNLDEMTARALARHRAAVHRIANQKKDQVVVDACAIVIAHAVMARLSETLQRVFSRGF